MVVWVLPLGSALGATPDRALLTGRACWRSPEGPGILRLTKGGTAEELQKTECGNELMQPLRGERLYASATTDTVGAHQCLASTPVDTYCARASALAEAFGKQSNGSQLTPQELGLQSDQNKLPCATCGSCEWLLLFRQSGG